MVEPSRRELTDSKPSSICQNDVLCYHPGASDTSHTGASSESGRYTNLDEMDRFFYPTSDTVSATLGTGNSRSVYNV